MKKIILSLAIGPMLLLAGCAGAFNPDLTPYSVEQTEAKPEGVKNRFYDSRVFPFEYEDVFAAANKAVMRTGFKMTGSDPESGTILAFGTVTWCPAADAQLVVAVYAKAVPGEAQTNVIVVTDLHNGTCFLAGRSGMTRQTGSTVFTELQKILSVQ